jgi:hypothetical protein
MEQGTAPFIKISLVEGLAPLDAERTPGYTSAVDTPRPIGTPTTRLDLAFGTEYEAYALARLYAASFTKDPPAQEYLRLEGFPLEWQWSIAAGEDIDPDQTAVVELWVEWRAANGQGSPIKRKVWERTLEIHVKKPLIETGQLNLMSAGSGLLGALLAAPWLFQRGKDRVDKLLKRGMYRPALVRARELLTERFNENELRTLCFDLNVDYESLPGEAKPDRARELVLYLERQGRFSELIEVGARQRPDMDWE